MVCGADRITYKDLEYRIEEKARFFLEQGLRPGDKVAVFLPNSLSFIVNFFALSKIGVRTLTLNANYKEDEIKRYLKTFKIKHLISNEETQKVPPRGCSTQEVPPRGWNFLAGRNFSAKVNAQDQALCQFSSGSTGRPKMVVRTHANLISEAKNVVLSLGFSGKDRILCCVPLFHAYGFGTAMTPAFYSGATLILTDKFHPRQVIDVLEKERVTFLFAVPYMFNMLADANTGKEVKLPALKFCFSAGISLPAEVSKKFYNKFGVYARDLYGTTETGCLSANLNKDIPETFKSVGLPIKGVEIDIMLENGKEAKTGRTGEFAVKAPTCGRWYETREKREPVFKKGYFYPGDIGKKDKDNNLYILGRKTTFINVAGEKVDPKEVEAVLKKCAGIKEVVVVASADPLRGEAVKAVIVPDGTPPDKKTVLKFCRERLADFKVPRIVEFRDEIPRSALGKVLKGYL